MPSSPKKERNIRSQKDKKSKKGKDPIRLQENKGSETVTTRQRSLTKSTFGDTSSDTKTPRSGKGIRSDKYEPSILDGSVGSSRHHPSIDSEFSGQCSSSHYTRHEDIPVSMKKKVRRYRGFSTSIQRFFLDESLVCTSIGCFGLLLSQRTEFLLNVRNRYDGETKRVKPGTRSAHRSPSKILILAFFAMIAFMGGTYIIWGFGDSDALRGHVDGYNDDQQGNYQVGDDAYKNVNDDDGNKDVDDNIDDEVENDDEFNEDVYDDQYEGNNFDDEVNDDQYNQNLYQNKENDDYHFQKQDDATNEATDVDDDARTRSLQNSYKTRGTIIRDYQEIFWQPFIQFLQEEWENGVERKLESEQSGYKWANNVRLAFFLFFLLVLGVIGRRRRMRTRWALARARAKDDEIHYGIVTLSGKKKHKSLENHYEIACAHTLFGCYPVDPDDASESYEGEEEREREKKEKNADCLSRCFSCVMCTCCGCLCKCWIQFLSVCALAQEAREVKLLVPPKFQRIDLLTHQPFSDYQGAIYELRRAFMGKARRKGGLSPHFDALSQLSRQILTTFFLLANIIGLTLYFNPRASFPKQDSIVLGITFFQSFLFLYIFHWIYHKADLSVDAVIKLFAAGFFFAAPTSFIFEGILVNMVLGLSYLGWVVAEWFKRKGAVYWIVNHYRHLWIAGELFNAYIVTAITEEFCKYYSFRAIEHPDLLFLTGLNEPVVGGVRKLNSSNSRENSTSDESSSSERSELETWLEKTKTDEDFVVEDEELRPYRKKAAAVTIAMISVAVGIACAENFLYIFLLDGRGTKDLNEVWTVMLLRSVFPVHALAAAMQSIYVIRKFVENNPNSEESYQIGVGQIVCPAILLHGSFDAIVLAINIYIEVSTENFLRANNGNVGDGDELYDSTFLKLAAWGSAISIMLLGLLWYYLKHRSQVLRLRDMEQAEFRDRTQGRMKYNPTKISSVHENNDVPIV